jgi:DNA-binding protein H-NS
MSDVNEVVSGKSLEELMAIQEATNAEIENAKAREVSEFQVLVDEVKAKAEVLGIDIKPYFVEKKEYPDKYVNPANSEERFNGRGPNPAWMKELLKDVPKEQWKEAKKAYLIAA